jgi:hypothetical protein
VHLRLKAKAERGLIRIINRPEFERLTGGCHGEPEAEHRALFEQIRCLNKGLEHVR